MEKAIKEIPIWCEFEAGDIKIKPSDTPTEATFLILYDNLDLRIKYTCRKTGITRIGSPIKSNNSKLIWQRAQQQIDLRNDKRYNKPFEDDGAYADD
jgi:hypothetical protein